MTKLADGVWGWAGAEHVNASMAACSRVARTQTNKLRNICSYDKEKNMYDLFENIVIRFLSL